MHSWIKEAVLTFCKGAVLSQQTSGRESSGGPEEGCHFPEPGAGVRSGEGEGELC